MIGKDILILTSDLSRNQTYLNRYTSFSKVLKSHGYRVTFVGVASPFKPHPINEFEKTRFSGEDVIQLNVIKLNIIQKLLIIVDKLNIPYSIKKLLMALHILVYKTDYLSVDLVNFKNLNISPNLIIASGSGGILTTASLLSEIHNSKLILDYRDPWNFGYTLLGNNKWIKKFKTKFTLQSEIRILQKATAVTIVSESLKSYMPAHFQAKTYVLENGSNFEEHEIINRIVETPLHFNIVYLGSLYPEQLRDLVFFKELKDFIQSIGLKPIDIQVHFLGSVNSKKLHKIIEEYQLKDYVNITTRLSHEELIPYLSNASMFLHLKYADRNKIITSKNADYLMFKKPILLPLSDEGDLEESILKNNAGYVCRDKNNIKEVLEIAYNKHLSHESCMLKNKGSYQTRTHVSERLVAIIEKLVD